MSHKHLNPLNPRKPKRVAVVISNPGTSTTTGWPIGFWWAELTHPYWEMTEHGYHVDLASPDGGKLDGDSWSDPRDASKYSAHDLISLGFVNSPEHRKLTDDSKPLQSIRMGDYDGVFVVGGQGPMYTFYNGRHLSRDVCVAAREAFRRPTPCDREDVDGLRQFGGGLR